MENICRQFWVAARSEDTAVGSDYSLCSWKLRNLCDCMSAENFLVHYYNTWGRGEKSDFKADVHSDPIISTLHLFLKFPGHLFWGRKLRLSKLKLFTQSHTFILSEEVIRAYNFWLYCSQRNHTGFLWMYIQHRIEIYSELLWNNNSILIVSR